MSTTASNPAGLNNNTNTNTNTTNTTNNNHATTAAATTTSAAINPFVCNVCHKTYGRTDHLARHFRSRKLTTPPPPLPSAANSG
jgi:hypothetical protein